MKKRPIFRSTFLIHQAHFFLLVWNLFFGGTRGIILEPAALSFPLDESCNPFLQLSSSLLNTHILDEHGCIFRPALVDGW